MAPITPLDVLQPTALNPISPSQQQSRLMAQGPTFEETLRQFVESVNAQQQESGKMSERFIKGEAVDIHDVMIAAEKAKTSFQLLMELRNKALDLYREAMRIQV
ncbi:MAG: flagellar hook-basal body complex protein FliE [Bacteroidota bacterium]|nr:flagellar hook-basal body complex protein FliE [Candidatus Kapabacteria bacterium]MCS7302764.1 flagellar hook-basal body complex protein FliE [Candidatus Kapabacteria bacterium]MCX7937006.1 flagellar hook-basal body complex protein FliE [Chlorobiota bacterium]MDW8075477.1 flagellar hook-basal body complex protein FliE [Bacteroidota bacterium]MDW8272334.1 flagellar hook-basal body complex protein FliE [Bacteroidota bacterium]